jgi:hypothetical protein
MQISHEPIRAVAFAGWDINSPAEIAAAAVLKLLGNHRISSENR